jgi:hypothetical protein
VHQVGDQPKLCDVLFVSVVLLRYAVQSQTPRKTEKKLPDNCSEIRYHGSDAQTHIHVCVERSACVTFA